MTLGCSTQTPRARTGPLSSSSTRTTAPSSTRPSGSAGFRMFVHLFAWGREGPVTTLLKCLRWGPTALGARAWGLQYPRRRTWSVCACFDVICGPVNFELDFRSLFPPFCSLFPPFCFAAVAAVPPARRRPSSPLPLLLLLCCRSHALKCCTQIYARILTALCPSRPAAPAVPPAALAQG